MRPSSGFMANSFCWLGKRVFNHVWQKIWQNSPRTSSATRIPHCSGYFLREEDEEIRRNLEILCKGEVTSVVKTLLLHGPSGYGKVYSAANLMHTLYTRPISNVLLSKTDQGKFKRTFVKEVPIKWTLDVTSKRTLFESYRSLAKEIGLNEEAKAANSELALYSRTPEGRQHQMNLQHHYQKDAYDEALKQIYEDVMKRLREQSAWVLLVEGPTEKVAALRKFWPEPGDRGCGNGLVIITTHYPSILPFENADDSTLQRVYIGEMTHNDAVNFLVKKTGIPSSGSDAKYAKEIAIKMLKCNPQDIAIFGAFVREHNYERNKTLSYKDLAGTETETPYEPVACVLNLEMNRRNQAKLLKFLACCSGENYLPLQCLDGYFPEGAESTVNESKFVDVLERDGVKVVKMHPLHHTTLRNMLTSSRKPTPSVSEKPWYNRLRQKLLIPETRKTDANIPSTLSALDISQTIECFSKNCKDALERSRDEDFVMLRFVSPHLKEAVELYGTKVPEIDEESGLPLAHGHACLGEVLLFLGESDEARKNLKIALEGYNNFRGPENILLEKANVLHFLGEVYGNSYLGDPSQGERYLKEALKQKELHFEEKDDPQVAFTLRSLANVLNELGKHEKAIEFSERAVDIHLKSGSDFTQELGYSLSTLGSSYRYLNRYVEAENHLEKALDIFMKVDSPSTLRMGVTLSRLASVQRNLGKLDESIESLEKAEKMFGHNDIYRAVIISKLGVTYHYKENPEKSLHYATQAETIINRHGNKDHPVIATALLNLGHAQSEEGSVKEAEGNLTKALDIYRKLHGENHRLIALTLNYLGYAYLQMGQVWKAKETLERAVKIMNNDSPSEHPEKANSFKRLSKACLILGETVKTADLANRALEIYNADKLVMYGNMMEHREVRKCSLRVVQACSKLGLFTVAEQHRKQVDLGFPEEKKTYPEFAVFLRTKTELALDIIEFYRLDGKEAEEEMQNDLNKGVEIIQKTLGCKHLQYAFLKKERARLYLLIGQYQEAYKEILSVENIILKYSAYKKPDVHADLLLIKADIESKLELPRGQEKSLQDAERLCRDVLGHNHPMLATTLQKLCKRNIELRRLKQAEEYLEGSYKICENLKTSLRQQLDSSCSDFLSNYSLDQHPVLKRQQQLEKGE